MAQYNTTSSLNGLFKSVYGDDYKSLMPETAKLLKMLPFKQAQRIGKKFEFPVLLSREHGVTYLNAGDGVQTLNDHVASVMKNVEVDGAQIIARAAIDYEAAAKAQSGKEAFVNATELLVENLLESISYRQEISFLYGQSGIGVADSSANVDTTHTVVTLTVASFAPGIWAGSEGAKLHFYNVGGSTLVSSSADAIFNIDSVDLDNRTITLSGTTTGIGALDTALGSADRDIYFYNSKGKECAGLDKIITNTSSLFGIDASSFALWKGSSYAAGGVALTMAKVLAAVGKAVAKGGLNEKVVCLVNPVTWGNLNSDQAALRKYDNSYKSMKGENGFESILYHGQNGEIEVISHPMIKQGEAFIFPPKRVKRIGASDITFQTPGREDEIFLQLPSSNGFELRSYAHQAIVCECPAKMVKITGIVNS